MTDLLEQHLKWWIEEQRAYECPPGELDVQARLLLKQYRCLRCVALEALRAKVQAEAERDRLHDNLKQTLRQNINDAIDGQSAMEEAYNKIVELEADRDRLRGLLARLWESYCGIDVYNMDAVKMRDNKLLEEIATALEGKA